MKKIITLTLLLAVFSFACTKKLECWDYSQCPYLSVYIDPFYYPSGKEPDQSGFVEYEDMDLVLDSLMNLKQDVFYGKNNIYYSDIDSNIIVYVGYIEIFLIRACQTLEECVAQAQEHDIVETFKHEFMRLQKAGVYPMSEEYADSVSDHIVDKLRNFEGKKSNSLYDSIYAYVAYNSQCSMGTYLPYGEYFFDDRAYMNSCYWPPDPFAEELDSCNASLEPEPIIKNRVSINKNFNIEVENNIIHISGYSITPTGISIVSPIGKVLEQHRINSQSSSIQTNLPKGNYLAVIKFKNGQSLQKIIKIS